MRKKLGWILLGINLVLYSFLVYAWYKIEFYPSFYLKESDLKKGWSQVSFYSYPYFDSAKVITSQWIIYINPPSYYQYNSYYLIPPFKKKKKMVIFTNPLLLKLRQVRELFWKEQIEEVYLPYFFYQGKWWDDFNQIIIRKLAKVRFYFKDLFVKKSGFKLVFFYPFKGNRRQMGAFFLTLKGRNFFFSYQIRRDDKVKFLNFLKKSSLSFAYFEIPNYGNLDCNFLKSNFIVWEDDTISWGKMKLKNYLSSLKNLAKRKRIIRLKEFKTGVNIFIPLGQGKEIVVGEN